MRPFWSLALACVLALSPFAHAEPGRLSAYRCELLYRFLTAAGFLKWTLTRDQISPEFQNMVAQIGLKNLEPKFAQLKELIELVTAEVPLDAAGIAAHKKKIQEWVDRNKLGLELVYEEDIKKATEDYKKRKLVPQGTVGIEPGNGYIDDAVWNLLIKEGKFPVVDPHDLLTHLPSFLIPEFGPLLKRKVELTTRLLQITRRNALEGRPAGSAPHPLAEPAAALDNLIGNQIRNNTWENLLFLSNEGGTPRLVLHGNSAYRLPRPLLDLSTYVPAFSTRVRKGLGLGDPRLRSKMDDFAAILFPPSAGPFFGDVPRRDAYLSARPGRYNTLLRAQSDLGLGSREQSRAIRDRASDLGLKVLKEHPELTEKRGEEFVHSFLEHFAVEASKDPVLVSSLSLENRLRLMKSSLDLYDDYLGWMALPRL